VLVISSSCLSDAVDISSAFLAYPEKLSFEGLDRRRQLRKPCYGGGGGNETVAMAAGATGYLFDVYLFGPLAVADANRHARTPRSQKSRALIALLALSPRGSRSRVWLRDKLWSDKGEEQASASLRQALVEVRKALGPQADQIIFADKHTISIDLSRVRVDALELLDAVERREGNAGAFAMIAQSEFLEGLDICDPEFEEWLTLERQIWHGRMEMAHALRSLSPKEQRGNGLAPVPPAAGHRSPDGAGSRDIEPTTAGLPGWSVALLPPTISGEPAGAAYLTDLVGKIVSRSLLETGDISVSDFSRHESTLQASLADRALYDRTTLAVQSRHRFSSQHIDTTLSVHRTSDHGLLWIGNVTLDRAAVEAHDVSAAHPLLNEAVDEIKRHFVEHDAGDAAGPPPDHSLLRAINAMFRLSRGDLAMSEEVLRRHIEIKPSSQAFAWLAFLMTFRIGQRFTDTASTYEQAQECARKALELDNGNAVTLALVGHVHSFLFGEYDFASGLFERSIRVNPTQPLSWDLYSMLHAYAGQPEKGLRMAKWARHLGTFSPIRYYFDTSRCINAALSGQYDVAIEAGEQALRERPDFNSLLRYLAASRAHIGDMETARRLLDRLEAVEPDFSVGSLVAARYPILQTEGGSALISGLIKAGARK